MDRPMDRPSTDPKKSISSTFLLHQKPKCSIQYFVEQVASMLFSLPLSQQAADQLADLENIINELNMDDHCNDTWNYSWGPSRFSSSKAYNILIGHTEASPLFTWLWASSNLGKHKFFWLMIRDRLNTRNLLRRKNMHLEDYSYVLCNSGQEETSWHLFFECPFSQLCWDTIPIIWNLDLEPFDMVLEAKKLLEAGFLEKYL